MYGKVAVYLYDSDSEAITYLNAFLWVVTKPVLGKTVNLFLKCRVYVGFFLRGKF
jgi:hypothetical protein